MTRSPSAPRVLFDDRDHLGEGPVFDVHTGELWWVDITPGVLHQWSTSTGVRTDTRFPVAVGAVILTDRADTVVLALAHELCLWAPTGATTLARLATGDENIRFNDCRADPGGRLFAGTLAKDRTPGAAALYRLEPDGELRPVVPHASISNGMGWDPGNERMYYIDSLTQRIDVFDYDLADGWPSERRPWVAIDPAEGLPDGMAVDAEGGVWVALFSGGVVRRYAPDGALDAEVRVPVINPTCPAFGGPDLATMYVTTARHRLTDEQLARDTLAGALLAFEPGVTGLPTNRYGGA